jgi:hypothetical protein
MNLRDSSNLLRLGMIIAGVLLVLAMGIFGALNYLVPTPTPPISIKDLVTPTPTSIPIPTATATATPSATATPPPPTPTPTSSVPLGGIIYALSPDINSVGWVQANETGNHFGESYLYTGLRDGILHHGAMQFDLSFIPLGSTIFFAELDLTGLIGEDLTPDSAFVVNILNEEADPDWSRHNFETIHNTAVVETLSPAMEATELGEGQLNKFTFNAAERSIIEDRLESRRLSFRLDILNPEQAGWFAWDSGYGESTRGQGPVLRLGILPPLPTATPVQEVALAEAEVGGETGAEVEEAGPDIVEVIGTLVLITSTPTPENIQTAAAIAPALTYEATTVGTPTPLPPNWVTPIVVTETPTPQNTATALFQQAEATAAVIAYGTSTPIPSNLVIATPTPTATATPIFILLQGELPPTETPTPGPPPPTLTMQFIQPDLLGKIAFKSNRTGEERYYVINPDGSGLALLTNCWAYALAEKADVYSADGRYRVFTKDVIRYRNVEDATTGQTTGAVRDDAPGIYWYDSLYKAEEQLSKFGAGIAYGGVWSPTNEQIAFISTESQNDEIWVANIDSSGLKQLTRDEYAWWDKHPSWSPDGTHIVFWSNRTGHGQIFVMNSDGGDLYSLSRTGFDDTDPVWIKYPGIPSFNPDSEDGKPNYIGSPGFCGSGGDLDCSDFPSRAEAQAFYTLAGGPFQDPYDLDRDDDGLVCE